MNKQFDELAKRMAQSVTRRAALKRFGVGLAAFALAAIGLAPSAHAGNRGIGQPCKSDNQCQRGMRCVGGVCSAGGCITDADCPKGMVCHHDHIIGVCGRRL